MRTGRRAWQCELSTIDTRGPSGKRSWYSEESRFFESCPAVPANRLGYVHFSGYQLKIVQEVVTIIVFIVFATTFLKEKLAWIYLVAFLFLGVQARLFRQSVRAP